LLRCAVPLHNAGRLRFGPPSRRRPALTDIIWLTLKLAAATTLILMAIATPLAWWLARSRGWWTEAVAAVVALPIVLPPTVLGFYLLIALGPESPLMALLRPFGVRTLAFTFEGLVIGSVIYSLPFAVQPLRNAFRAIGDRPMEAAATLRASPLDAFFSVAAPLARPGFVVGAVLTFAHTIGEFGVVLMIGGGVPGETEVLSIEIYRLVEALDWGRAHILAGGLLAFAFLVMLTLLLLDRRLARVRT
jgi:molybdate transport system permease protein